jgi:GT2 family glycosyltransferase
MKHTIIIPFYQRLAQVKRCVLALQRQSLPDTSILLVNDGTDTEEVEEALESLLSADNLSIIHHQRNRGVAAARNTAIQWSRDKGAELILMIDSDCEPGENFISGHIQLHQQYPEAACFGAGVIGRGSSFWAKLDRVISWVHSVPHGKIRRVDHPYHLPTTNLSIKISMLPDTPEVFDPRLRTGEDALFIRQLRQEGKQVLFSPEPSIFHYDREQMVDVFKHHYVWGHHQYFIQLNKNISARSFNPLYRTFFLIAYLPCIPLFALLGSILNIKPWLKHRPHYLAFYPLIYLVWLGKAIAVAEAAIRPRRCLILPNNS